MSCPTFTWSRRTPRSARYCVTSGSRSLTEQRSRLARGTSRSEERRVGKECRSRCDWSSDVCSSDLNVHLVAADATERTVLRDLGLEEFDGAAVTIGEGNVEANVLVTLILKDLGVPMIFSRANDSLHAKVLERVGADHVVQPEKEFGEFLARQMALPGIQDYLDLGEDEALIELEVPSEWVGKALNDLQLHRKKDLTVLAIKNKGQGGALPQPGTPLEEGTVL